MSYFNKTKISDGIVAGQARLDGVTEAFEVIDYAHHEIHAGESYIADYVDTSMGDTEYIGIAFTTPAATVARIHIFMAFASKAAAHLDLIETPGTLTGGTALTAYNRDMGSSNITSVASLKYYDSTASDVITGGTVKHDLYTWADKKYGGKSREVDEFVLAPSTVYAFKLTADAATNAGHIILNYYEHVDRN